jgi:hypothetical protein
MVEVVSGSECVNPRIHNLWSSWRWVVSFTPWLIYPLGKRTLYPLDRGLGGPQSRSGWGREQKNLEPTETRTPTPRQLGPWPVAAPTELSRFPADRAQRIMNGLLLLEGVLSESKISITFFSVMTPCSLLGGKSLRTWRQRHPFLRKTGNQVRVYTVSWPRWR